jgi:hypothetical protein
MGYSSLLSRHISQAALEVNIGGDAVGCVISMSDCCLTPQLANWLVWQIVGILNFQSSVRVIH